MRDLLSIIILANALVIFLNLFSLQLAQAAATFTIVNLDGAGEGFNEATPAAPVGGNTGTTLGQQRLNAFQHAANIWGGLINSPVNIRVRASFDPLVPCSPSSGVLGAAGPNTVHRDFAGAPLANTWYVQALANSRFGGDLSADNDIQAFFSSIIGTPGCLPNNGWYFGLDGNPPVGRFDFVTVLLHELGHGLGFLSLVNAGTGAKFLGFDDAYMLFLENHTTGKLYHQMTDSERVVASTSTGNLHFTGANVVAESVGHARMYAPNPAQSGSSVSHFDTTVSPIELMEPFYTGPLHDPSLTVALFEDLGWVFGDQTAPDKITNLKAVTPTQQTNITLHWTAPGDDGNAGTATSYDMHVSNAKLSEATWNTATAVIGEMAPLVGGSPESMTVGNLLCGRTYYFGMKTTDNDNNTSVLSNVATGKTAPCNRFSPSPKILPPSEAGVLYTKTIDLVNGATPFNVLFDVVPAWLTINAPVGNSFSVTGTPPLVDAGTTVILAGAITDAVGSVLKTKFMLKIAKPVQITTTTVKAGKVNTNYTATLKAKDGVKAYTWSVDGVVALPGNAPLNLVAATGKITVLPTVAGSVDVTFRVTDAAGGSDTQILTLTFN